MALAASGVLSTMMSRAKKTLGQCTCWQDWTGHAADETAATLHIAEFDKQWEESAVNAGRDVRCVIGLETPRPVRGGPIWQATVVYHFEAPVSSGYSGDPEQAFREFQNNFGLTLEEMRADSLADTSGLLLFLREAELSVSGPFRTPESENQTDGDMIWADLRVPCGPKE